MTTVTINGGGSQAVGFVAGTDAQNNQQIVNGDHNYVVGTNLHRFVYTVRPHAQPGRSDASAAGEGLDQGIFIPIAEVMSCGCMLPAQSLA